MLLSPHKRSKTVCSLVICSKPLTNKRSRRVGRDQYDKEKMISTCLYNPAAHRFAG